MKKVKMLLAAVLFAAMLALVGCENGGMFGFAPADFDRAYEKINEAVSITETLEIKNGNLLVYGRERNLVKEEGVYNISSSEKTLNPIDGEHTEPYTVKEESYSLNAVAEFIAVMEFDDRYFEAGYFMDDTTLRTKIADMYVERMLSLEEGHAEVSNLYVELRLAENEINLASLDISYVSEGKTVAINYAFAY